MISANPEATAEFEVESITGKRVPLKARFLTSIERERLRMIQDRIVGQSPKDPGILDAAREAIELGISGSTVDELRSILTDRELCLLAVSYDKALDLTEIDLGKSMSRLVFNVGKSAATAVAPAATSQAS